MAVHPRGQGPDTERNLQENGPADPSRPLSMHNTRPERTVFVEEDNTDGWISTDLTLDIER